jgi:hypothetical protein
LQDIIITVPVFIKMIFQVILSVEI